jgi:hypothetical protein
MHSALKFWRAAADALDRRRLCPYLSGHVFYPQTNPERTKQAVMAAFAGLDGATSARTESMSGQVVRSAGRCMRRAAACHGFTDIDAGRADVFGKAKRTNSPLPRWRDVCPEIFACGHVAPECPVTC